jgi:hypothetical protein
MKNKPFYLAVFKTPNDSVYDPFAETHDRKEAIKYADAEVAELRKFKSPNIDAACKVQVVIEEWESEEDYDESSGSVETIYDKKIFIKPDYEGLKENL